MIAATGIPERSPIQVLTRPDVCLNLLIVLEPVFNRDMALSRKNRNKRKNDKREEVFRKRIKGRKIRQTCREEEKERQEKERESEKKRKEEGEGMEKLV